jgi:leucyl-tRNA synthetase
LNEFTQFLTVLNPFAPHLSGGNQRGVLAAAPCSSEQTWPAYDPAALVRSEIEFIIQVNGKLRDRLMLSKDADEDDRPIRRPRQPKVKEHTDGKTIRKIMI